MGGDANVGCSELPDRHENPIASSQTRWRRSNFEINRPKLVHLFRKSQSLLSTKLKKPRSICVKKDAQPIDFKGLKNHLF
jgi:hypothetical protein